MDLIVGQKYDPTFTKDLDGGRDKERHDTKGEIGPSKQFVPETKENKWRHKGHGSRHSRVIYLQLTYFL